MNIILVGQMGSGKDLVANHLMANGYIPYKLGKYIRKHVDEMFPKHSPDERRSLYQVYGEGMREVFGTYFWCERVIEQIEQDGNGGSYGFKDNLMITDARQHHEIAYWVGHGFIPVGVETDEEIRLSRLMNRDGAKFSKDDINHHTELSAKQIIQDIKEGIVLKGIVINNSKEIRNTFSQVENLILYREAEAR